MAALLDTLTAQALELPADQRASLAQRLLDSLDPEQDPEAEALWEEEIRHRIAQLDSGQTTTVAAADFFAELERLLPERSGPGSRTEGGGASNEGAVGSTMK